MNIRLYKKIYLESVSYVKYYPCNVIIPIAREREGDQDLQNEQQGIKLFSKNPKS